MSYYGSNVPDDWGSYYTNCDRCGTRYHMSDGGCGCMESLENCMCRTCNWNNDYENPRCNDCGTGPETEGNSHSKVHVARKEYKGHGGTSEVRPGDRYRRTVHFSHYPDGPCTLVVTRRRLEKGPAWTEVN